MKNINISFKDLISLAKQKTHLLFWVALLIVLLMELWVLQRAVSVALNARNNPAPEVFGQTVRVNFSTFNDVLKEVEGSSNYFPEPAVDGNPFGLPAAQQSQQ